jgi:hypothetical protein
MLRRLQSCRATAAGRRPSWLLGLCLCAAAVLQASAQTDRRQSRLDDALRREGEALVRIADDAAKGKPAPQDFALEWSNDFFKAQPGTFVPFTLTFDRASLRRGRALLYVRAERDGQGERRAAFAYETIFPVELEPTVEGSAVVRRGFAVPPGRYRVIVALRESPDGTRAPEATRAEAGGRRTSVLTRDLQVPDFWTGELATSTVMLADRLETVSQPVPANELDEDPYAVGGHRIHPTRSRVFGRNRELIVVFLVYNPTIGPNRHFDVQVDYHLYSKDRGVVSPVSDQGAHPPARPGERYVTRTNPQRFNPSLMGSRFDPEGAPVLAGQGILLSSFEPGEYRLGITVTDLLSRKSLSRDVTFTVIGS